MMATSPDPSTALLAGLWTDAVETYQHDLRAVLAKIAAPLIDQAEQDRRYPTSILHELGAAGHVRRRWQGGPTGDVGRGMLLAYEFGRLLCGGIGTGTSLHVETAVAILHRCRARVPELYERALAAETICCVAVTEPQTGSDVAELTAQAVQQTDGSWLIDGTKRFISLAQGADVALVLARTGGPAHLTFFAVPRGEGGYGVTHEYEKLGTRSLETCDVQLDSVRVGDEHRVCAVGAGFPLFSQALTLERLAGVAQLVGALETAVELTAGYLRARPSGTGTLWDHQALRHKQADLISTHGVLWHALLATTADLQAGRAGQRDVAALKLMAATMVERALSDALQLLGGIGYTTEWPIERALRDCRIARIGAGTDEIMREIVAGTTVDRASYEAWVQRDGHVG
jgi:alkylation response protein AidB-like acyl-CoA dehydrogenase